MRSTKSPETHSTARDYERELEFLYSRRSTLDALISSLEEYDRFRAVEPVRIRDRKSA
jgi:hypothetical protein